MKRTPANVAGLSVYAVKIVDRMYLETDGTTTDRRVYVSLPPEVAGLGPYLSGIQCTTETENRTTNFRWNAEVSISADGLQFFPSTPSDLFGYVSTDATEVQTELTDTTKFGAPVMRVNVACSNSSGTNRESATVSLWLTLNLKR